MTLSCPLQLWSVSLSMPTLQQVLWNLLQIIEIGFVTVKLRPSYPHNAYITEYVWHSMNLLEY